MSKKQALIILFLLAALIAAYLIADFSNRNDAGEKEKTTCGVYKNCEAVTAITSRQKKIFTALLETIEVYDIEGNKADPCSPFIPDVYITSLSENERIKYSVIL